MSDYANPDALVSTEWLAEHLQAPDVCVVDATWYLPNDGRKGRETHDEGHIPGAVFFDIDDICDEDDPLPHMLPSAAKFSSRVRKLGLGDGNRIVVYDANGGFMAAARVWWTFRYFGHEDISLLDGGLPKWMAEGRPVDDLPTVPREKHFTARLNNTLVRDRDHLLANIDTAKELVVDARSTGRFNGTEPEPREGMKAGHIPGSVSLPFQAVMDPKHHCTLRPANEIKSAMAEAGITADKSIVTSCGSGVTASFLALAFHLVGREDVAVYDGSWTDWGSHPDTPVVKD